jgi:hypothetical protein
MAAWRLSSNGDIIEKSPNDDKPSKSPLADFLSMSPNDDTTEQNPTLARYPW